MSEYGTSAVAHAERRSHASVPFVVLASLLCGVGLFGVFYWLLTFDWLYFASLIPLIIGALMFFTRGSGPDHA